MIMSRLSRRRLSLHPIFPQSKVTNKNISSPIKQKDRSKQQPKGCTMPNQHIKDQEKKNKFRS